MRTEEPRQDKAETGEDTENTSDKTGSGARSMCEVVAGTLVVVSPLVLVAYLTATLRSQPVDIAGVIVASSGLLAAARGWRRR
jgi:hypothetical protein